ncbi:helix-turn-helix transcriptional regulator [Streptomyces sp. RFCAC02]|uniref:helix-turn-helix domain-containing protein n=1 Tax=Streptomyces sp. RFCAC02 TaxID=2499143 RepID=UPI001020686D|nr:helix-turn-helix transcriptional regulator [Streptomyces sp. RFCAC02]
MPQRERPLDDTTSLAAWFGVELRNWRKTRKLSTDALSEKAQVSASLIERIEKAQRSCNTKLASRLDDVLEAGGALRRLWRRVELDTDTDADADTPQGVAVTRTGEGQTDTAPDTGPTHAPDSPLMGELPPVERRSFLTLGGGVGAALTSASLSTLFPRLGAELPRQVRAEDIEQIRTAARGHTTWDARYGGGGLVRATAIGQLIWAHGLLGVECPSPLRPELLTAVGELAMVMGASAFDSGDHPHATQLLELGVHCAEQADNWHLRARAYSWRSRQATWCGSPDTGLTLAETGLVRADRLTHRERGMLHIARARALAKLDARQAALAAIGRADDAWSRSGDGEDAPWMAHYDYAQHLGDTGHAAVDLAALGHSPDLAITRLKTAVQRHTDVYVRSRALSGTKLATLLMTVGDPQEAVSTGHRALDEIGQLRSQRAITEVQALAQASAKHSTRPDVAYLRERITATVTG